MKVIFFFTVNVMLTDTVNLIEFKNLKKGERKSIKNRKNKYKLEKKWKEDEAKPLNFTKKQKYMKIAICILEIIE